MKFWKITALICCLLIGISVFGCNKRGDLSVTKDDPVNTVDVSDGEVPYEGGIHVYNVKETSSAIVANGASDYVIVYPADASSDITIAVDELKQWIQKSTGVVLESRTDADVSWDSSSKYISLGNTVAAEQAEIALTQAVGFSGFQIKSKGNSIFVIGETEDGVLFGVYELLYRLINFRTYSSDESAYDVKDRVSFYEFDITDVPDFNYRVTAYGLSTNDTFLARRLRYNQSDDVWIPVDGKTWHNTFAYLPPDEYKTEHPEWYSSDGTQICFLAHGNQEEADALYETLLAKLIECLEEYPERQNITITQEDKRTWCRCDACSANLEKYGTDAATIVQFCNKISADVKAYFKEKNVDRVVNICFFAYQMTNNAPVIKNADGTYSPVDDSVICDENVCVFYAPIDADYSHSFYENENSSFAETMKGWKALSDKLYLWIYSTNFNYYLYPYNSFNSMQANYWFALNQGGSYMFDQGQWNNSNSTGWGRLKVWLNSKLQWDSSLNMNDLIDEFFTNYYKQAAKPMSELFDLFRMQSAYIEETKNITGGIYNDNIKTDLWPQSTLKAILAKVDEAYKAIEPLKANDPEEYEALYDRICLESIAYRYLYIQLYEGRMTTVEANEEKLSFKEDCTRLNVTKVKEGGDITELWASWGIA